jgi:hypothetical protein
MLARTDQAAHDARMKSMLAAWVVGFLLFNVAAREPDKLIELWPGTAPGEKGDIGEEKDTTKPTDDLIAGKRLVRLGNVSKPTLSVFRLQRTKTPGLR